MIANHPIFRVCEEIPKPIISNISYIKENSILGFKYMTSNRFVELFQRSNSCGFPDLISIDCRFSYEYLGGTILGSINIRTFSDIKELYEKYTDKYVYFVFFCEFSHERAQNILALFRYYDRSKNIETNIKYENLFILENGFKNFIENHVNYSVGKLISMRDQFFVKNVKLKK